MFEYFFRPVSKPPEGMSKYGEKSREEYKVCWKAIYSCCMDFYEQDKKVSHPSEKKQYNL